MLRNGSVRGFFKGILLQGDTTNSSGHLVEDMILDSNTWIGLQVEGTGNVIRNNRVVNTGPNNQYNNATGIAVVRASNSLIVSNLVSKTNESDKTYGIYLSGSTLLEVRGNSIFETAGGIVDNFGIYMSNADDITIIDNRILNKAGTGSTGIIDDSNIPTDINCIGNTIDGFAFAVDGCDNDIGNNKL